MAIALIETDTAFSGVAGDTLACAFPADVEAEDLLIICTCGFDGSSLTVAQADSIDITTDFNTASSSITLNSAHLGVKMWGLICDGAETGNYTVTWNAAGSNQVGARGIVGMLFRDVDLTGSPTVQSESDATTDDPSPWTLTVPTAGTDIGIQLTPLMQAFGFRGEPTVAFDSYSGSQVDVAGMTMETSGDAVFGFRAGYEIVASGAPPEFDATWTFDDTLANPFEGALIQRMHAVFPEIPDVQDHWGWTEGSATDSWETR